MNFIFKKGQSIVVSKNFKSKEFDCKCGNCTATIISPKLIELNQRVRDRVGYAYKPNSAYRCSTHNKKVGGSTQSQHLAGNAVDLPLKSNMTADRLEEIIISEMGKLKISGGIGKYNSFVHFDVRGSDARWNG